MNSKLLVRLLLAAAFVLAFFCVAPILQSCSEGPEPFSDFSLHPDVPLEKYASGHLGVVHPTFARSYLVVAYRYFSAVPLTKDEQLGAQALWISRIGDTNVTDPNAEADRAPNTYIEANSRHAREDWLAARKQISGLPALAVEELKDGPDYLRYVNCGDDALANAVSTLNARVKTFGKENPGVQEWLRAQDTVFINCGNPASPAIPDAAPSSLPELLRFDREYQIAAAHMYANQYDEAGKTFEKIAAEEKSPWHAIAPYLIVRNLVRRATLDVPAPQPNQYQQQFNSALLSQAESKIQSLLGDPRQKSMQAPIAALLDRVEFHLRPASQTVALSQRLRASAPDGRFYHWLCDYTRLLDSRPDANHSDFYSPGKTDAQSYISAAPERQSDELTDWILTFQAEDNSATEHALQVWHAHPGSTPWLLSVLAKTDSSAPYVNEVLTAADKIPANSPAYITAFYHRMRLRNATKQFGDVRKSIDALLKTPENVPGYSISQLTDLRLDAAADLDDALQFIGKNGCENDTGFSPSSCNNGLGPHSAEVLDSLPLDVLVQAYQKPALPQPIKDQMARNIWMRAVLLGRHDVAQKLNSQILPAMGALPQGIKPEYFDELKKQYEDAATPEEKQFSAVFLLQHQYAFGYEMGSNQPWCASPSGPWQPDPYGRTAAFVPASPAFSTPEQSKQAAAERKLLDAADSQANYYAKVAIDFAQAHPDDPRVPESLSRAVKNTDRNCNNARTSPLSKKAFVLLHSKYSNTTWAKNTKYWY